MHHWRYSATGVNVTRPLSDDGVNIISDTVIPPTDSNEYDNTVIVECEMVEGGNLIKAFPANNEDGVGNFYSFVMTPIRILKVHYLGDDVKAEIKDGDVITLRESYYWVTSDMEDACEEFGEGKYITHSGYYPMMLGKRYLVYATVSESGIDDYGVKYKGPVLYSSTAVCLSEDSMHYERLSTYTNDITKIRYMEIWNKYSGKDTLDYSYADVFKNHEDLKPKITHIDKSEFTSFENLESKEVYLKNQKNAVILKCIVRQPGEQVSNTGQLPYLDDYETITMSTVKVLEKYYEDESVELDLNSAVRVKVYEPYYQDADGNLITHSRYYPMEDNKTYILFAYSYEHEGETVLIPVGQAAAVSFDNEDLPEHMQVALGPEGVLQWFETQEKY